MARSRYADDQLQRAIEKGIHQNYIIWSIKWVGQMVEDLSGNELSQRYFHAQLDHLKHTTVTYMLHLILGS